jgi:A/G-specific adenine glycosylase
MAHRPLPLANPKSRNLFRRRLLCWYDSQKRELPWRATRATRDPYRVWLSEIMLQQTRVASVIEYYQRFLKRFPTVETLASARLSSVLALWSGLGYYRRARMLHGAARKIVKHHAGEFPRSSEALRKLPGIGRYTAAAIASIAFNEPVAAVDGNVERVLERVQDSDLHERELWQFADDLLSRSRPGDFNQAMMELGATLCLPQGPQCLLCPVFDLCRTRGSRPQKKKENRRKREIHYTLDCRNGCVFLVQRPRHASLMPGMWELPEISTPDGGTKNLLTLRHAITVTDYVVRVMRGPAPLQPPGRWVARSRLGTLPLTGLTRKILKASKVI